MFSIYKSHNTKKSYSFNQFFELYYVYKCFKNRTIIDILTSL